LRDEVIPALLASRPNGGQLRAWSAGCSTGEEAYSLAIVFREALKQSKAEKNYTLQIFATDLDADATACHEGGGRGSDQYRELLIELGHFASKTTITIPFRKILKHLFESLNDLVLMLTDGCQLFVNFGRRVGLGFLDYTR
jgi:hypothetical protein